MEILSKEVKPIALKIIQFGNRHRRITAEPFYVISLSTLQSRGDSPYSFHLRRFQKDVTVNSHFDRRMVKRCFQEGRGGLSRNFNNNGNFATFGKSGVQVPCETQI